MTEDLKNKFIETVIDCLETGRPFSGYNITIWTRRRENIKIRHQDCGSLVHSLDLLQDALDYGYTMSDGQTYTWQKSTFTNWAGPHFEVYHPVGYNLNNFVPEGVDPSNQNEIQSSLRPISLIGQVTPQADGSQPDAGGDNQDGTYRTDFRNRLLVPTRFLREANISAGNNVHIFHDNNSILISNHECVDDNNTIPEIALQRVERNGDLRISDRTLRKANLVGKNFMIENANKLVNNCQVTPQLIKIVVIKLS